MIVGDILDPNEIADYASYYGFITAAILLFAGLVAPEVLVGDRRNGMLAMYLSTPLKRSTYLVAKAVAVLLTLAMVTLGPPLLLLIGYTFENAGPDGPGDWLIVLLRIFVSAFAVCGALTAVSMAAASLTDRRAFASIGVVLLALASPAVAVHAGRWCGTLPELAADRRVLDAVRARLPDLRRAGQLPRAVDAQRRCRQPGLDTRRHRRRRLALLPTGGRPMSDDTPVRNQRPQPSAMQPPPPPVGSVPSSASAPPPSAPPPPPSPRPSPRPRSRSARRAPSSCRRR